MFNNVPSVAREAACGAKTYVTSTLITSQKHTSYTLLTSQQQGRDMVCLDSLSRWCVRTLITGHKGRHVMVELVQRVLSFRVQGQGDRSTVSLGPASPFDRQQPHLGYGKDSFLRQPYEPLKQQTLLLYDADC